MVLISLIIFIWKRKKYRKKQSNLNLETYSKKLKSSFTKNQSAKVTKNPEPEFLIPQEDFNNLFNTTFLLKQFGENKSNIQIKELIELVIKENVYLVFNYSGDLTLVKPLKVNGNILKSYCYIENKEKDFTLTDISDPIVKEKYFICKAIESDLSNYKLNKILDYAISNKKYLRMKYNRPAWNSFKTDTLTGELITESTAAEESIRTINNLDVSTNSLSLDQINKYRLDNNYITGYCFKRKEQRTFKKSRIVEIALLDL